MFSRKEHSIEDHVGWPWFRGTSVKSFKVSISTSDLSKGRRRSTYSAFLRCVLEEAGCAVLGGFGLRTASKRNNASSGRTEGSGRSCASSDRGRRRGYGGLTVEVGEEDLWSLEKGESVIASWGLIDALSLSCQGDRNI